MTAKLKKSSTSAAQSLKEITMKELPDEKILLELLEMALVAEQKAREMSEFATAIASKYQKRMSEIRQARKQGVTE